MVLYSLFTSLRTSKKKNSVALYGKYGLCRKTEICLLYSYHEHMRLQFLQKVEEYHLRVFSILI
jgi:hypothetical protein